MSAEFSCNLCKDKSIEPFKSPNDPIGVALMQQHLQSEHGIEAVWPNNQEDSNEKD